MTHELKTWTEYFELMNSGVKTFELRKNDRNFKAGHLLILKEFDKNAEEYTHRELSFKITYVLEGSDAEQLGLKPGYCILGLGKIEG